MKHSDTQLPSLVIVGNGMVAGRLLDELLAREGQQYRITVIGAEPHGSYNRIMLSSVLANDATPESIIQKDHAWYAEHNIALLAGKPVTEINREEKWLKISTGEEIAYDHLILATGSRAARIPAKNLDLDNVFLFRTLADTDAMIKRAATAKSAIVVGGGLLGLEAAYGLAKFGTKVTLVHRSPWLLNRQLDKEAGDMLKNVMSKMGIEFRLKNEIDSFIADENKAVCSARLKCGEEIPADLAVVATGITPNAELGLDHGLEGQRAIRVDDFMQTSDEHISALGECIEHRGDTFGLVDPLWRQAETLAARLVSQQALPFHNQATATKLKVSGVQLFSAGEVQTREGLRAITIKDSKHNIYRKLLIEDALIKGIVLFGDVRSGNHYFDLMQNEIAVGSQLHNLIVGQEFVHTENNAEIISAA